MKRGNRHNTKGSALLNVLLMIVIVGILSVGIISVGLFNSRWGNQLKDYEGAYYQSEAAVNAALDALKVSTVETYNDFLRSASATPSVRQDLTISNEEFYAHIAQNAMDMLDEQYRDILTITEPSSYTPVANGVQGDYQIVAQAPGQLGVRKVQATLTVRKLPLTETQMGGLSTAAITLANDTSTFTGTIAVNNGDVVVNDSAGFTPTTTGGYTSITGSDPYTDRLVVDAAAGSITQSSFPDVLWQQGIVSYIQNNGAGMTGFADLTGKNNSQQNKIIENPSNTILFYNGDFTVEPDMELGGKMLFVNGAVTVVHSGNSNKNSNVMIFAAGDIEYQTERENNSDGSYVFLYSEGSIGLIGQRTDAHLIAFAQQDITVDHQHRSSIYDIYGQLICGNQLNNLLPGTLNVSFPEDAQQATASFYGKIDTLPDAVPKPQFTQVTAGGRGTVYSLPQEDLFGGQSSTNEKR